MFYCINFCNIIRNFAPLCFEPSVQIITVGRKSLGPPWVSTDHTLKNVDQTHVSCVSRITGRFFTTELPGTHELTKLQHKTKSLNKNLKKLKEIPQLAWTKVGLLTKIHSLQKLKVLDPRLTQESNSSFAPVSRLGGVVRLSRGSPWTAADHPQPLWTPV